MDDALDERNDAGQQDIGWLARRSLRDLVVLGGLVGLLVASPILLAMVPRSNPSAELTADLGPPPPPPIVVAGPSLKAEATEPDAVEPPQAEPERSPEPEPPAPESTTPVPRLHVASTPSYDPAPLSTGVLCGAPLSSGGYCRNPVKDSWHCHLHDDGRPAYSAPSYSSGQVHVRGYYRKDGTYVRPHSRSRPRR